MLSTIPDIARWPLLKWSRLEAFPFLQIALGKRRSYDVFPFVALMFGVLPSFLPWFPLPDFSASSSSPWQPRCFHNGSNGDVALSTLQAFLVGLFPWLISMARFCCANLERNYLSRVEARWVQRIWAASFWHMPTSANTLRGRSSSWFASCTRRNGPRVSQTRYEEARNRPSTMAEETFASEALRNARPMFAIVGLVIHVLVFLLGSGIFLLIFEQVRQAPCLELPRPFRLEHLFYINNNSLLVSTFGHLCYIMTCEAAWRIITFACYLLGWVFLSQPDHQPQRSTGISRAAHVVARVCVTGFARGQRWLLAGFYIVLLARLVFIGLSVSGFWARVQLGTSAIVLSWACLLLIAPKVLVPRAGRMSGFYLR